MSEFLKRVVKEYPGQFRCDKDVLFCLMCDIRVSIKQLSQAKQHISTQKHQDAIDRKSGGVKSSSQSLLTTLHETVDKNRDASEFALDLAKCFLESNIPLHKISHPSVANFIEKHTKYAVPSETSLRQKYLPVLYDECIEKMKKIAANNFIWCSIDESTDSEQRFVANFVFGVLNVERERGKSYLFASKVLEATNSSTVATFFDECIAQLGKWKSTKNNSQLKMCMKLNSIDFSHSGVDRQKVLLVVTDNGSYMKPALQALKVLYPKMIHVTCGAHGLHRVAECVRDQFKNVNKLVSNIKRMFTKVL